MTREASTIGEGARLLLLPILHLGMDQMFRVGEQAHITNIRSSFSKNLEVNRWQEFMYKYEYETRSKSLTLTTTNTIKCVQHEELLIFGSWVK